MSIIGDICFCFSGCFSINKVKDWRYLCQKNDENLFWGLFDDSRSNKERLNLMLERINKRLYEFRTSEILLSAEFLCWTWRLDLLLTCWCITPCVNMLTVNVNLDNLFPPEYFCAYALHGPQLTNLSGCIMQFDPQTLSTLNLPMIPSPLLCLRTVM